MGMVTFQITISATYGMNDLKVDLQNIFGKSGPKEEKILFLFTEGQITNERFLVYINDLLSSGEIADLYTLDESNFQRCRGFTTIMAYEDGTNNQIVVSINICPPLGTDIILTTVNDLKYRFSIPYIPDNSSSSPDTETVVYSVIQTTNDPIFSGGTIRVTRLKSDDNYLVFTLFSKN